MRKGSPICNPYSDASGDGGGDRKFVVTFELREKFNSCATSTSSGLVFTGVINSRGFAKSALLLDPTKKSSSDWFRKPNTMYQGNGPIYNPLFHPFCFQKRGSGGGEYDGSTHTHLYQVVHKFVECQKRFNYVF
jgi:hypothetical protein